MPPYLPVKYSMIRRNVFKPLTHDKEEEEVLFQRQESGLDQVYMFITPYGRKAVFYEE